MSRDIKFQLILSCLVGLFHFGNYAQKTNRLNLPNNLSTESKKEITKQKSLFLVNTLRDETKNYLPFYSEHKEVSVNQLPSLEYNNPVIRELTLAELEKIKDFKQYISSSFEQSYHIAKSRNQTILFGRINAIRLNETTNKYEYLEKYEPIWNTDKVNFSVQTNHLKTTAVNSFANNSVLGAGVWYKIGVTKNGVYKLNKAFLTSLGIDLASTDPRNIRIYGNGGKLLPEKNNKFRYDDLQENAIEIVGENDGVFNDNDYILFYGQSTDYWKTNNSNGMPYQRVKHFFSDTSFYFLTVDLGPGKRIQNQSNFTNTPDKTTSTQDFYGYHENDLYNVVKSGREFYGEKFDFNTSYSFNFNVPDAVIGDSVYVMSSILGRANSVSNYNVSFNNGSFPISCSATNLTDYLADIGYVGSGKKGGLLNSSNLSVTVSKQTSSAIAWLDKIEFNARRNMAYSQSQFNYRDKRVVGGTGTFAKYTLTNYNSIIPTIWDITDPLTPKKQDVNITGNLIEYTSTSDSLKEFCAFNESHTFTAKAYGKIKNQNLHAIQQADYIIVTHPLFLNEANRLAELHKKHDSLTYAVATTEEIYNEFSSGTPDITAIRDFVRMLYKRPVNPNLSTKYVLLFGDGSYRSKDLNPASNSALIPVYETPSSSSFTGSFVSDDYYGMLDDNEGELVSGLVDVGVGRFTVHNQTDAVAVVNKIEQYLKIDENFDVNAKENLCADNGLFPQGDWRNRLTFVADDEDGNLHLTQADNLANSLAADKNYNVNKIYLDAYSQYSTPGGDRFPDAVNDINTSMEKGCLIWNYTGHGGEVGLAEERIIEIAQIQDWKNINNLPLIITATCEFTRYDDPDRTSAGELCLLQPKGGGIGLFTTTRVAYSNYNEVINNAFFSHAIKPMPNGKMPRLGDLYRLTKIDVNSPTFSIYK